MPFDEGRRGGHAGENLLWLRDALRAEMPLGFAWDFSHIYVRPVNRCGSAGCALGLAMQRWPEALVPALFQATGDRRYPAHVTAVTGLGVHEQWARFSACRRISSSRSSWRRRSFTASQRGST